MFILSITRVQPQDICSNRTVSCELGFLLAVSLRLEGGVDLTAAGEGTLSQNVTQDYHRLLIFECGYYSSPLPMHELSFQINEV